MAKGDNKKDMMERFREMGIPQPVQPVKNVQRSTSNPEMASKMEQIRNGGLRGQYAKFIEKETATKAPATLPVPKVGKKPNAGSSTPPPAQLSKPSTGSNPQAQMLENMMFGNSSEPSTNTVQSNKSIEDFGPSHVDTRTRLKQRLAQKQNLQTETQQQGFSQEKSTAQNYDDSLESKITEIATVVAQNVSKSMIKKVLLEYAKNGKDIIMESKTVKKAEIVGRNQVKIGGKVYKLTPIK